MQVSNVKRGSIFLVNLTNIMGKKEGIQSGYRACIVVSNDLANKHSKAVTIIPLTTRIEKKLIPTHCYVKMDWSVNLKQDSIALCEQIFTINKDDLGVWSGAVTKECMREIDKCLAMALGLLL